MKKLLLFSALLAGITAGAQVTTKGSLVPSAGSSLKSTQTTTTAQPGTHVVPPGASTQTNAPARPVSEPFVPKYVSVNKTINDYGTIQKGADPYCQFDITNNGTEPLVIKSAYGSCGCTVPEYPKDPIPAGKTITMKVRYDTQRIGPFIKKVFVLFEGHDADNLELVIRGTVETPPADQPFGTQPVNPSAPLDNGVH